MYHSNSDSFWHLLKQFQKNEKNKIEVENLPLIQSLTKHYQILSQNKPNLDKGYSREKRPQH